MYYSPQGKIAFWAHGIVFAAVPPVTTLKNLVHRHIASAGSSSYNTSIWETGFLLPYPGTPPASMWLASVTSCDQTSYCHFWSPITPHRTFPEWTPTRILMSTPVASRTFLSYSKKHILMMIFDHFWLKTWTKEVWHVFKEKSRKRRKTEMLKSNSFFSPQTSESFFSVHSDTKSTVGTGGLDMRM